MIAHDKVVVGSSLSAAMFAFNNQYPLLFSRPEYSFRFDYFPPGMDLSFIGIEPMDKELKTFGEPKLVGTPRRVLWETIIFALSVDGLCPLSDLCYSMRNVDGRITCSSEYFRIGEFQVSECVYFGDDNAQGFVTEREPAIKKYICYDWIAINKGGKISQDYFKTSDDFVNEVWLYSSDRIDGDTGVKDACVISYLTQQQLKDFDYSETMARFKMLDEMEKRGLKGPQNGLTTAGNPKHYKIRATHMRREKKKNYERDWTPHVCVVIPDVNEEDLLLEFKEKSQSNDTFLRFYSAFSGNNTGR
tara:strand:+ start:53640 stop:54548 length:909 start_codon:yes stop_codon:yes gene_type:complete